MEEPLASHSIAGADGTAAIPSRFDDSIDEPACSPSNFTFICRVSTVLLVTAISLWANYEAAKGFDIIVFEALGTSLATRHYNLMFVANGGAARAILNASPSIERALYTDPQYFPRKPVNSVTLRVADYNLTRDVIITATTASDYVIRMSPTVIEERDAEKAVVAAVYMGMARVWVRDGWGMAPTAVVDAAVGYLCGVAGFRVRVGAVNVTTTTGCEVDAAGFVEYCEERRPGFVARLNKLMEERWDDGVLDMALGTSARVMCVGFRSGLGWIQEHGGNLTGKNVEML